jgi:hypothetical protein
VYHDSAEVIDPVHLVTIISRREKTKQT